MKIGAKVVAHARYAVFHMAEVAVPRDLFGRILALIGPPTTSAGAMLEGCDARVSRQTGGIPPPWRIMRRNRRAGIGAATATVFHGRTLAPPSLGQSHVWLR